MSLVFDDFLTLVICCLARQTQEELYFDTIRKYGKDEIDNFAKLFAELIKLYSKVDKDFDWIDPLGDYYEALSSEYKKKNFGQFFTPKSLCDLMAAVTVEPEDYGNTILEPACGSGRLILAANKICRGNYFVAKDLDHICVKICCINMAFHGVKGEVLHTNALSDQEPFNVYLINYDWYKSKTPFIYKLKTA